MGYLEPVGLLLASLTEKKTGLGSLIESITLVEPVRMGKSNSAEQHERRWNRVHFSLLGELHTVILFTTTGIRLKD